MKKSLSLILAIAMVFSMFATVALAADEPTTAQEMFDALKAKGIFEGVNEQGDAALDKEMTRAEYAAVLVRLLGLEKKTGTPSYDDTANHWAHKDGYIEAVTPKYMEGTGPRQFSPDAPVTLEQLATIAVRALGLDIVQNPNVSGKVGNWVDDKGVSAAQYVATAIENGLISNVSDFTVNALREQLVITTYAADKVLSVPEKQTLVSAQQVGAKKVQVTFGRDVDADTQIVVKKGTLAYSVDKIDVAGKVATVTLKDVLTQGTYTVEASGAEGTVQFAAVNQTVGNIQLAGDVLPKSTAAKIEYKVYNQFGEEMTPPSNLTWIPGNALAKITKSGNDVFVDLSDNLIRVDDLVPITVVFPGGAQASKTYKVGAAPTISTIILKELKPADEKADRLVSGKTGYIEYEVKDQYGNKVETLSELQKIQLITSTSLVKAEWVVEGTKVKLKVSVDENLVADTPVVLTAVTGSGASNSLHFEVFRPATIDRVELVQPDKVVADGDTDVKIDLVAYDQFGNKLDKLTIAQNADKIRILPLSTSVMVTDKDAKIKTEIITTTDDKGMYRMGKITGTGTLTLTAMVGANSHSINIDVQEARYHKSLELTDGGADKLLAGGAKTTIKFDVKDQYNETQNNDNQFGTKESKYEVELKHISGDEDALTLNDKPKGKKGAIKDGFELISGEAGKNGEFEFTVRMITDGVTTYTWSKKVTVTDGKGDNKLTYEIEDLPVLYKAGAAVGDSAYEKEIKLIAKDKDGNTVAIPDGMIIDVSPRNDNVIVKQSGTTWKVTGNKPEAKEDLSSLLIVTINAPHGAEALAKNVTVSKEEREIVSIKFNSDNRNVVSPNKMNVVYGHTLRAGDSSTKKGAELKLEVKDQFGGENYWKDLTNGKLTVVVSGNGKYEIYDENKPLSNNENDQTNWFTFDGDIGTKYTVTAYTYNGLTATATITIKAP